MIIKRTVLILGAGASCPYGYPSGYELLTIICGHGTDKQRRYHTHMVRSLEEANYGTSAIRRFCRTLAESSQPSVDAFLECRPQFMTIGKPALASVLSRFERESHLFNKANVENWYQHLFERMDGGNLSSFAENNLSVITFNYDRSLKHYLFTALQSSYGHNDEECATALSNIPVVHVHGSLGPLSWENGGRRHGEELTPAGLIESAKSIKIVHEGTEEDPEFQQARQFLKEAQRICFLGFGFHPINLERLQIAQIAETQKNAKLSGTAKGRTNKEKDHIRGLVAQRISLGENHWGILDFLRETMILGADLRRRGR